MYEVGQQVLATIERCSCQGGGRTEVIGKIVQIIQATNGLWYKLDTISGIKTVHLDFIVGVH